MILPCPFGDYLGAHIAIGDLDRRCVAICTQNELELYVFIEPEFGLGYREVLPSFLKALMAIGYTRIAEAEWYGQ